MFAIQMFLLVVHIDKWETMITSLSMVIFLSSNKHIYKLTVGSVSTYHSDLYGVWLPGLHVTQQDDGAVARQASQHRQAPQAATDPLHRHTLTV